MQHFINVNIFFRLKRIRQRQQYDSKKFQSTVVEGVSLFEDFAFKDKTKPEGFVLGQETRILHNGPERFSSNRWSEWQKSKHHTWSSMLCFHFIWQFIVVIQQLQWLCWIFFCCFSSLSCKFGVWTRWSRNASIRARYHCENN